MALKAGRVGINPDQLDFFGRIKKSLVSKMVTDLVDPLFTKKWYTAKIVYDDSGETPVFRIVSCDLEGVSINEVSRVSGSGTSARYFKAWLFTLPANTRFDSVMCFNPTAEYGTTKIVMYNPFSLQRVGGDYAFMDRDSIVINAANNTSSETTLNINYALSLTIKFCLAD